MSKKVYIVCPYCKNEIRYVEQILKSELPYNKKGNRSKKENGRK